MTKKGIFLWDQVLCCLCSGLYCECDQTSYYTEHQFVFRIFDTCSSCIPFVQRLPPQSLNRESGYGYSFYDSGVYQSPPSRLVAGGRLNFPQDCSNKMIRWRVNSATLPPAICSLIHPLQVIVTGFSCIPVC